MAWRSHDQTRVPAPQSGGRRLSGEHPNEHSAQPPPTRIPVYGGRRRGRLRCGAFKSRHQRHNLDRLDRVHFPVLDFDRDDARQAGLIRAELSARGVPIEPYDVLIAGQAVARDLILVTRNTREFSRVPGLRIADWEA